MKVNINGTTFGAGPFVPVGGYKKSGYGSFNGVYGIQEFTWPKVRTCTLQQPFFYSSRPSQVITIVEGAKYPV